MKSVEEYLKLGYDRKYAESFAAGRKRPVSVSANDDFTLCLQFDNGERRVMDCKPFLRPGTVFEPFMDIRNFKRVYLDAVGGVAWDIDPAVDSETVWENRVDLSPDTCYVESVRVP